MRTHAQLDAAMTAMGHGVSPTQVVTCTAAGNGNGLSAYVSSSLEKGNTDHDILTYSKNKIKVAIFRTPTRCKVTFMSNIGIWA